MAGETQQGLYEVKIVVDGSEAKRKLGEFEESMETFETSNKKRAKAVADYVSGENIKSIKDQKKAHKKYTAALKQEHAARTKSFKGNINQRAAEHKRHLKAMESAEKEHQARLDALGQKKKKGGKGGGMMGGLASMAGPVGAAIGAVGGAIAGVTKLFGAANEKANEMADNMARVSTLLSDEQAQALPDATERLRDIAKDIGAPLGNLQDTMYGVISAAPQLAGNLDAVAAITEKSARTAKALGAETSEIASTMTSMANAAGLPLENLGTQNMLLDVIANTMKQGVIPSGSALAANLAKTAPGFAALNKEAEDTVTVIGSMTAILTANGVSIDESQTQMKALTAELLDATKRQELMNAGLKGFDPETGKVADWSELIRSAGTAGDDLIGKLGSTEAQNALRILSKGGGEAFAQMQTSMEGAAGTAEEMFSKVENTAENNKLKLQAGWNDMLITLGSTSSGVMDSVTVGATAAINWVNDLFTSQEDLATRARETAVAAQEEATAVADMIAGFGDAADPAFLTNVENGIEGIRAKSPEGAAELERLAAAAETDPTALEKMSVVLQEIAEVKAAEAVIALNEAAIAAGEVLESSSRGWFDNLMAGAAQLGLVPEILGQAGKPLEEQGRNAEANLASLREMNEIAKAAGATAQDRQQITLAINAAQRQVWETESALTQLTDERTTAAQQLYDTLSDQGLPAAQAMEEVEASMLGLKQEENGVYQDVLDNLESQIQAQAVAEELAAAELETKTLTDDVLQTTVETNSELLGLKGDQNQQDIAGLELAKEKVDADIAQARVLLQQMQAEAKAGTIRNELMAEAATLASQYKVELEGAGTATQFQAKSAEGRVKELQTAIANMEGVSAELGQRIEGARGAAAAAGARPAGGARRGGGGRGAARTAERESREAARREQQAEREREAELKRLAKEEEDRRKAEMKAREEARKREEQLEKQREKLLQDTTKALEENLKTLTGLLTGISTEAAGAVTGALQGMLSELENGARSIVQASEARQAATDELEQARADAEEAGAIATTARARAGAKTQRAEDVAALAQLLEGTAQTREAGGETAGLSVVEFGRFLDEVERGVIALQEWDAAQGMVSDETRVLGLAVQNATMALGGVADPGEAQSFIAERVAEAHDAEMELRQAMSDAELAQGRLRQAAASESALPLLTAEITLANISDVVSLLSDDMMNLVTSIQSLDPETMGAAQIVDLVRGVEEEFSGLDNIVARLAGRDDLGFLDAGTMSELVDRIREVTAEVATQRDLIIATQVGTEAGGAEWEIHQTNIEGANEQIEEGERLANALAARIEQINTGLMESAAIVQRAELVAAMQEVESIEADTLSTRQAMAAERRTDIEQLEYEFDIREKILQSAIELARLAGDPEAEARAQRALAHAQYLRDLQRSQMENEQKQGEEDEKKERNERIKQAAIRETQKFTLDTLHEIDGLMDSILDKQAGIATNLSREVMKTLAAIGESLGDSIASVAEELGPAGKAMSALWKFGKQAVKLISSIISKIALQHNKAYQAQLERAAAAEDLLDQQERLSASLERQLELETALADQYRARADTAVEQAQADKDRMQLLEGSLREGLLGTNRLPRLGGFDASVGTRARLKEDLEGYADEIQALNEELEGGVGQSRERKIEAELRRLEAESAIIDGLMPELDEWIDLLAQQDEHVRQAFHDRIDELDHRKAVEDSLRKQRKLAGEISETEFDEKQREADLDFLVEKQKIIEGLFKQAQMDYALEQISREELWEIENMRLRIQEEILALQQESTTEGQKQLETEIRKLRLARQELILASRERALTSTERMQVGVLEAQILDAMRGMGASDEQMAGAEEAFATASYDVGTPYVPQDQMAQVHKGERIWTATQNEALTGLMAEMAAGMSTIAATVDTWEAMRPTASEGDTTNVFNIDGSKSPEATATEIGRVLQRQHDEWHRRGNTGGNR